MTPNSTSAVGSRAQNVRKLTKLGGAQATAISVPLFHGSTHRFFVRASVSGFAWRQGAVLVVVIRRSIYAWRALLSMHISKRVHIRRRVEAVALPNRIGDKWCRTSDVTRKVRAGRRHGPRVAVPCRHDQTASPDRLRASRYSFFVDVCIVSLSGKSQSCVSVCNVEMQCLLARNGSD